MVEKKLAAPVDIIDLLIRHGADLHARGEVGTPLALAIRLGETGLADLLRETGGSSELDDAVAGLAQVLGPIVVDSTGVSQEWSTTCSPLRCRKHLGMEKQISTSRRGIPTARGARTFSAGVANR